MSIHRQEPRAESEGRERPLRHGRRVRTHLDVVQVVVHPRLRHPLREDHDRPDNPGCALVDPVVRAVHLHGGRVVPRRLRSGQGGRGRLRPLNLALLQKTENGRTRAEGIGYALLAEKCAFPPLCGELRYLQEAKVCR